MKHDKNEQETEYWRILGRCLREWRLLAGLSQEKLAKKAGISRAELQFIEAGQRRAKLDTLKYYCKALKITPVMLLSQVDYCQSENTGDRQG